MPVTRALPYIRSLRDAASFRFPQTHRHTAGAREGNGDCALTCPHESPRSEALVKLDAQGLSKSYGSTVALHPLDLKVHAGERLILLGPSGSGKTTLLQTICGLVPPASGRLFIDGQDQTHMPVNKRDIGVVFQNYALFPHLTVRENVSFPLQMRKTAPTELRAKVERTLTSVGLLDLGNRFPRELSGGQQQRVALARCMVYEPSLILMDESLSALDRKLRESMQIEIKRLHRETGSTIIFVTHDQEEALALADRICLMNNGQIEQLGTPEELYEHPRNVFVADFIGISNLIHGEVKAGGVIETGDGMALPLPDGCAAPPGTRGALVIRPEKMLLCSAGSAFLSGAVIESIYAGSETKLLVRLPGRMVVTVRRKPDMAPVAMGETIFLRWEPERARFLEN